jgi:hypothetical protein
MKLNSKKIIDERQERQSLQNSNIVLNVMIIMLWGMLLIQTFFMDRGFSFYGPEFITLLTGCLLKLVLDIRQGNVYTDINSKTKLTAAIYVSAALIFAGLLGIRNYMLYDFVLWKIVFVIVPVFFELLILFVIAHFVYLKLSKKRLEKLERELDEDE